MTHENAGHYSAKHRQRTIDSDIAALIEEETKNGSISCIAAHRIAAKLHRPPKAVGVTIDLMEKRIKRCQLGLFGHGKEKRKKVRAGSQVDAPLETVLRNAAIDNRISCRAAWQVAEQMKRSKMAVGTACEALGVKVKPCQLGAF